MFSWLCLLSNFLLEWDFQILRWDFCIYTNSWYLVLLKLAILRICGYYQISILLNCLSPRNLKDGIFCRICGFKLLLVWPLRLKMEVEVWVTKLRKSMFGVKNYQETMWTWLRESKSVSSNHINNCGKNYILLHW